MASRRLDRLDRTGSALGALLYHRHRSFGRSLDSPSLREAVPATSAEVSDLTPLVPHAVVATGPAGMAATAALRAHVGHAVDAAMWHSVRRQGEQ